jgi:hypothetical protein
MKNLRHYRRNSLDILTWSTELGDRAVYALKVYRGNDPIKENNMHTILIFALVALFCFVLARAMEAFTQYFQSRKDGTK